MTLILHEARDVWSDDFLSAVVQCSFVLIQWSIDSAAGRQYLQLYESGKEMTFPYIALLDPQTGALVRKFAGPHTAETLAEKISDFLEKNPTSFTKPVFIRGVHDTGNEKSIISLVDSPTTAAVVNSELSVINKKIEDTKRTSSGLKRARDVESEQDTAQASNFENGLRVLDYMIPVESESQDMMVSEGSKTGAFKLSFKLPDNKRVSAEFDSDTTMLDIFSHVINKRLSANTSGFVDLLVGFPPKSILNSVNWGNSSSDSIKSVLGNMLARESMSGQLVTVKLTT